MPDIPPSPVRQTILVVDDAPTNIQVCRAALLATYDIIVASTGAEALEKATAAPPDLILMDIMMPDMDGYETVAALQKIPATASVPVIFMTALSDTTSHVKALGLGAVDLITKPFNLKILRHRVDNVLERDRLRREAVDREQRLAASLARQQELGSTVDSAFDVTNDALIITDDALIIEKLNANARLFFGKQGDLTGFAFGSLAFTSLKGEELGIASTLADLGPREGRLILPSGETRTVSLTARTYATDDGADKHLFSIQDISYRMELEESNRRGAEILHNAVLELTKQKHALDEHALVSITDRDGVITYANQHFCERSGFSPDELMGRTHRLLKSGLHSEKFYADLWATISQGKTWRGEIANRTRDGEIYWVASTIVPWLDDNGMPYQYVAIRTEITDRIAAEQAVHAAHQREMETAAIIQKRLLFGEAPRELPGFSIAAYSEASQGVDGDFYTFTRLSDECFEVLTGDVMGKGVLAAMIGAGVKNTYRQVLSSAILESHGQLPSVGEIANALNRELAHELVELNAFVTLSLTRYDRRALTVSWVNAGHAPALLYSATDGSVTRLHSDNMPMGVLPEEVYEEHQCPLDLGYLALTYSDGISESADTSGELYGEERIRQILAKGGAIDASPNIVLQALRSDVHDYTGTDVGSDDRTAIIVKVRPIRSKTRGTLRDRRAPEHLDLPRQLDQLAPLRERIAVLMADQPEEERDALILAAFEAATNVIRHTPEKLRCTPFTAVLRRDDKEVGVELIYAGKPYSPDGPPDPDFSGESEGGFGLYIIESCCDRVFYDSPMAGLASIRMIKSLAEAHQESSHA